MTARRPLKLAVMISGSGSNLQAIIDHIQRGELNATVTVVISDQPDAYGLQRAQEAGLETETVSAGPGESRSSYDARLTDCLSRYEHDLIVLSGFMRILSHDFVAACPGRIINIHPSLLPAYRGLHTHRRVLEAGDKRHGASVHFVVPALDAGPVIMQARVSVNPGETAGELQARVLEKEHKLYSKVIGLIADGRISLQDGTVRYDGKPLAEPLIMEEIA